MLARGLAVDQSPSFNCVLFRIRRAADDNAAIFRPCTRLALGWRADMREKLLQKSVRLELAFDLAQECFCDGPRVTKDSDCEFRIVQDVLDRQPDSYDCALVVLTSPQIEMPVRFPLYFPAPFIEPVPVHILALHPEDEQKEEIPRAKSPQVIRRLGSFISLDRFFPCHSCAAFTFANMPAISALTDCTAAATPGSSPSTLSAIPHALRSPSWISRSVSAEILASLARSKLFSAMARRFSSLMSGQASLCP